MNNGKEGNSISIIPVMKFILILGVIMIHSNTTFEAPELPSNEIGRFLTDFFTRTLTSSCVTAFFAISGYLFFYNVRSLGMSVFGAKLKRRFRTLLVPYLCWNTICCVLLWIKVRYFGYVGYGIFDEGGVNILKLLEGYIYLPNELHMPYAFAFWFIRNLMVFVLLAPVAYFVGRNWWILALLMGVTQSFLVQGHGFQFFCFGAALSLHNISLASLADKRWIVIASSIIYPLSAFLFCNIGFQDPFNGLVYFITFFSFFIVTIAVGRQLERYADSLLLRNLIASTFFLYAFHQIFVSVARKAMLLIFGDTTSLSVFLAMVFSFLFLTGVSFAVYLILRRLTPRLLMVLTGDRT